MSPPRRQALVVPGSVAVDVVQPRRRLGPAGNSVNSGPLAVVLVNWFQDRGFARWRLHGLDAPDDGDLARVVGEGRGGHDGRVRRVGEGHRVGGLAAAADHHVTLHFVVKNT